MRRIRLGVLGSGKGSNFVAIHEAIASGRLEAEVVLVASDVAQAGILEFARERGIAVRALAASRYRTKLEPELEQQLVGWLQEARVDLVVLAGYMRMIKEPMLEAFAGRIVNIHPSLLPEFPGLCAWKQALEAGVERTGCTVHWVDAGMDTGAVIAQRQVPVEEGDTAETLHARIQKAEHALYPEVLERLAQQWAAKGREAEGLGRS